MEENNSLYGKLKKLFSTNVVVRNVGGKQLKVADTDNIQAVVSNAMRDRYSRVHMSSGFGAGIGNQYGTNMSYQTQRIMLFRDYDTMDNDPIIASALDIYADESTVKNEYGEILTINSDNGRIKDVLHNLFYDILNIEFNLWWWVRNMVKYGDLFMFLEISPEYGIHNVMPLSVYDTERKEGTKPENPYYVYFETLGMNGNKQKFENYEIAHFRLMSDGNFLPYGKSMIEGARRIFRQLTLMEDAMMIHRIMRAPEKRIVKIDIGNIPPAEVDTYMEKLITKMKKVPFVDERTGEYNLRYNMQNLLEDFYLPVRGSDSGTSIENLSGLEYNSIEDIEYLSKKFFAALKIPKAFLGYDENVNGKATLAAEDVRFARTIERIQRIIVSELTKIAMVHLYAQGFRDEELIDFSLALTNPSTIYEQEKINLWTQKIGLVAQIQTTNTLSSDWVYKNVFNMPEDEFAEERERIVEDTKRRFRLQQIEQGQPDPAKYGFPQDNPTPPQNPNDMDGAVPGGTPPADPQGGPPGGGGGMPQSLDDLPTEDEVMGGGGDDQGGGELEESRGAPHKGPQYAQDSHVRGRDPLGFKERYKSMKVSPQRAPSKKSPLSLEVRSALDGMMLVPTVPVKSKLMTEDERLAGTFLDESILDFEVLEDTEE